MKAIGIIYLLVLIVTFLLVGCAHTVDVQPCVEGQPYGFWSGLWHGWISGITFIASLFNKDIAIYAVNNNGGWYNFGFILGCGSILRGIAKSTSSKK